MQATASGPLHRLVGSWPVLVAVLLGLSQPLVHAWLAHCPPAGAVPSALSIPDSALFLQSMDMFRNGFHSPYALCDSPWGDASVRYYAVPHLWLYGVLGYLGHSVGLAHFTTLGWANGVCLTLYLLAAWRFLQAAVPRVATPAYALFALASGPGGLVWLAALLTGAQASPHFDAWFIRFALYDLMEGPHPHPLLAAHRCYYTLPLACFYIGLAGLARGRLPWFAFFAVALGSLVYARAGLFSLAVGVLLATSIAPRPWRALCWYAAAILIGFALSSYLMRLNPATVRNHLEVTNMAAWFSPSVASVSLLLPFVLLSLRGMPLSRPVRALAGAGFGYLTAYALLYIARALYYGTLWSGNDGAVAYSVSDAALLGALPGAAIGWLTWRLRGATLSHPPAWALLWALGFFAVSISGFGQGAFLQLGPQRLLLFAWLPVCVLAAAGLMRLAPRWRRPAWAVLLLAGLASITVSLAVFQAGMGRPRAQGPFPLMHAEWISQADAAALQYLDGDAVLLARPLLSDAAVRARPGVQAPFAVGAFNLSHRAYPDLHAQAEAFFAPRASEETRRNLLREWWITHVLLSPTRPEQPGVDQELANLDSLDAVFSQDGAILFRVRHSGEEKVVDTKTGL